MMVRRGGVCTSREHALLLQGADVVERVAEPRQDVRVVLAELRRHAADAGTHAVPRERQADRTIVRMARMRRSDDHPARLRLRLLPDLIATPDPRARPAGATGP